MECSTLRSVARSLAEKWRNRPIDFWLQLSCFCLFAVARGYGRLLGVVMALLQWYQCGFMFFMAARWWLDSKGLAYVIVVLVIATSQALTFSITTFYFWQMDFVPLQGCSLPCLVLPDSNGKADENYLLMDVDVEEGEVGARALSVERKRDDPSSQGAPHGQDFLSRSTIYSPGEGRSINVSVSPLLERSMRQSGSLRNVVGNRVVTGEGQENEFEELETTPLLFTDSASRQLELSQQWSHYSFREESCANAARHTIEASLTRTCADELVRKRFVELHSDTCFRAHGLLLFGFCIITTMIVIDAGWERFFDGVHIRDFLRKSDCPAYLESLYFLAVVLIYWGMFCVVTACCLFFCVTRSMVIAISETERTMILPSVSLEGAIEKQERMVRHIRRLTESMSLWFIVHNVSFLVLILASAYWWLATTYDIKDPEKAKLYISVSATCAAIAYKFAFPLLAASRVTHRWKGLIKVLNRSKGWAPTRRADQNILLNYISRSDSGFVVCGIQVADSLFLLIVILLGSFLGLLRTIHVLHNSS